MNNLNLTLFPEIPTSLPILIIYGQDKYPELAKLGYLNQRIEACYHFLFSLFNNTDTYRATYFRAALNEFAGINQIIKEYNKLGGLDAIIIDNLPYPLMHFFKLLRDVSFHITTIHHDSIETASVIYEPSKGTPEQQQLEYTTLNLSIINSDDLFLVKSTRNAKYYDEEQIDTVIKWVTSMQNRWGINYLFSLAIDQYCSILANYLKTSSIK